MMDGPVTRPSLLVRLSNAADTEAWSQFVRLYVPLVHGLARRRGLQEADADDLTQEVFQKVSVAVGKLHYDARRGSFRSWLFTVSCRCLHDFLQRRARQCRGTGSSGVQALLEEEPAPPSAEEDAWDREYQQRVFEWAAREVRPHIKPTTWEAFWQLAVEGRSGEEVAQALGMSVGAVYVAKSRVLARLHNKILELEGPPTDKGTRRQDTEERTALPGSWGILSPPGLGGQSA